MTTTSSINSSHTHLDPSVPPAYLRRMIISTLHRTGAEGAEAGVIAEMERLLERHVQHLFETARDYAALANRASANHLDLLLAQDESSHSSRSLRRESRKRRRGIRLETTSAPADDTMAETLTSLADTIRGSSFVSGLEGEEQDGGGKRLDHAFEGAPALPPKWTYPPPPHPVDAPAPAKVTSAALNFVKATVADADVDPELGIVNYRANSKRTRQ